MGMEKDYNPRDWNRMSPYREPGYKSTQLRGPTKPLVKLDQTLTELTGPAIGHAARDAVQEDADLTRNARRNGEPIGERITVSGKVMDEDGKPLANSLVEIWQANATGRYVHVVDQHDAPLDPNFLGAGRCVTDDQGNYRFVTVRPGAYPWPNHHNAWRPPHIHFSLIGPSILTRLVTQMYFPGDPLLSFDPIFNAIADEDARNTMVASFEMDLTEPDWALGYKFDIVLRGRNATVMEEEA
jgi:protocatechuate 3,4-dioxygenase beta subunit